MNQKTPHIRICLFSFFEHEKETKGIIEHFENLLTQNKVFDKRWGFMRKKAAGTENSFYLGGGRIDLPKRQITFDNTLPPTEIFDNQDNNSISESIKNWCNSGDIFILCMDLQNMPETWKINIISYNIKQIDIKKTILFAVFDEGSHFGLYQKYPVDFNTYARLAVTQHIELINGTTEGISEELKSLLQSGYIFPYTDIQGFITSQNKRFILRKKVFCIYKSDMNFGYFDCLLYCINHIYKEENTEITITSNKLYRYLTNNINIKYYSDMAKSIKIAVVGTQDNGKSHCISDIFRTLSIMGISVDVRLYDGYAQVVHYLNDIVGKKNIAPNSPTNLTKKKHHHKGLLLIENGHRTIEFMDIPGEAFRDANSITGIYTTLKHCLENSYTHKWWKILLSRFPEKLRLKLKIDPINYFMEKYDEQGKETSLTLYKVNTAAIKQPASFDLPQTIQGSTGQENVHNRKAYKYVSGKDVVKNFEKYDTDNLKTVLKQIVKEQTIHDNLKNISDTFWQNFYAYVFCDNSTDMILCELLTLPINVRGINNNTVNTEQKNFDNCLSGIKTFFSSSKRTPPNLYVVFKGLDAMLNADKFKGLYNTQNVNDIKNMSTKIYYLVLLAIYKKFGIKFVKDFDAFFETAKNEELWPLKDKNGAIDSMFQHIYDGSGNILLDEILKDEAEFTVPRDNDHQGLAAHLSSRIVQLQTAFVFGENRFKPNKNLNMPVDFTNIIIPHIYFTAYPIDGINLTIHENSKKNRQQFDNLNISQRLPFGTFNLVVDLLEANRLNTEFNNGSNMENWLINN